MGKLDTIYKSLPHPLKVVALNIIAYKNNKQRYNASYKKYVALYNSLWSKSLDEVKVVQEKFLKELLLECYEESDWYRKKMDEKNITISTINTNPFTVLQKLPILKKTERKTNAQLLINKKRETNAVGYTSGTSGAPTVNFLDRESINRSFALWSRFHTSIGLPKKKKQVRLSGRILINPRKNKKPFWIYNYFEKQLLMSTYHLTQDNLVHYINKLNSFRPHLIDGYPSAIYIISTYINQQKIKLTFTPKAICTTAETLYDYQRSEIEKAFNCKVYNQYASSEGSPFITECVEGNLHLNLDSGIFEFITPDGKKAKPGELAQLVVTSFTNLKTPLLRYNIEDTVLLHDSNFKCPCHCKMPTINKITGREDDILWTEEKGYVGRLDTAYKGLSGIIKSQIIQESPNKVVINLIPGKEYNHITEKKLLLNLQERLGVTINYTFNKVSDIPLGPNGKFDAVKRNFTINR